MKKRNDTLRTKTTLIATVLLVAGCTPAEDASAKARLTPAEAKAIAKEAFYWGMHPVAIYHQLTTGCSGRSAVRSAAEPARSADEAWFIVLRKQTKTGDMT